MALPTESISKVKFNIGLKILELLGLRLVNAITKYSQGNLEGWFFELKAIKMIMIAKIPPTIKTNLTNKEKEIIQLIASSKQEPRKYKNKLAEEIESYNEQIQTILDAIGISIPSKEARHLLFGQKKDELKTDAEEEFTGM